MRRRLSLALLLVHGCSGGLTGEIASNACPTQSGSISAATPHEVLGGDTPEQRLASAGETVRLTWADDGTTTPATLSLAAAGDASVFEGVECDAHLDLPVGLRVRTDDGRLDHTFDAHAYLGTDGLSFAGAASVGDVSGFDPAAWAAAHDTGEARVRILWQVPARAGSNGDVVFDTGFDGEDIEVATW